VGFPGFDIGGFITLSVVLGFLVPIVVAVIFVVAIVWAVRRGFPTGRDAAEQELRSRLARGEISPSEYQARMDALRQQP
jgi:uncharacterized membrane protein